MNGGNKPISHKQGPIGVRVPTRQPKPPAQSTEILPSDSIALGSRTREEQSYDALADMAVQGRSISQIKEHVQHKHSPVQIARKGFLGALTGAAAGATWGAMGTALAAAGGVVISAALLVAAVGSSAATGLPIWSALPAVIGSTFIPSNPALLSQIPTIALGLAGLGGTVAAATCVHQALQQKRLDQEALTKLANQTNGQT